MSIATVDGTMIELSLSVYLIQYVSPSLSSADCKLKLPNYLKTASRFY